MKTLVSDASALLAMFFGQPGMEQMRDLFHKAADAAKPMLIRAANWAEALYKMQRKHGEEGWETARVFERSMPLDVAPLDRALAESAAQLATTHDLGLTDAFAAALAKSKKAELVTADTGSKALKKEIKINWLK